MIAKYVETLRQPEYTGENRCLPCTVVNLAVAVILGVVVSKRSKRAGVIAVGCSVALIALRGYLVPGTPELTKRYLPETALRLFGKSSELDLASGVDSSPRSTETGENDSETADSGSEEHVEAGEPSNPPDDLETYFLHSNVLEPCEDRDDLCLTEPFESAWTEEIDSVLETGVDTETVVEAFGFEADPSEFTLKERDSGAYILRFGTGVPGEGPSYNAGQWPSYAALVADVAAGGLFSSWLDEWDQYDSKQRGQILNSLRMFLETCPTADGGVTMTEETVKSCCSSDTVVAVVCEETGDRLFEYQLPD